MCHNKADILILRVVAVLYWTEASWYTYLYIIVFIILFIRIYTGEQLNIIDILCKLVGSWRSNVTRVVPIFSCATFPSKKIGLSRHSEVYMYVNTSRLLRPLFSSHTAADGPSKQVNAINHRTQYVFGVGYIRIVYNIIRSSLPSPLSSLVVLAVSLFARRAGVDRKNLYTQSCTSASHTTYTSVIIGRTYLLHHLDF